VHSDWQCIEVFLYVIGKTNNIFNWSYGSNNCVTVYHIYI